MQSTTDEFCRVLVPSLFSRGCWFQISSASSRVSEVEHCQQCYLYTFLASVYLLGGFRALSPKCLLSSEMCWCNLYWIYFFTRSRVALYKPIACTCQISTLVSHASMIFRNTVLLVLKISRQLQNLTTLQAVGDESVAHHEFHYLSYQFLGQNLCRYNKNNYGRTSAYAIDAYEYFDVLLISQDRFISSRCCESERSSDYTLCSQRLDGDFLISGNTRMMYFGAYILHPPA